MTAEEVQAFVLAVREAGARTVKVGDVEVAFGPMPVRPFHLPDTKEDSQRAGEPDDESLLFASTS